MRAPGAMATAAWLAALLTTVGAGPAAANLLPDTGLYAPVGLNAGYATHPGRPSGGIVGIEGSLVWFQGLWAGGYLDALYEPVNERVRVGFGPEIGFAVFGLDFGAVAELGDGEARWGFAIRGLLTIGAFALYGRYLNVSDDPDESGFGEVGVLLKWPFALVRRPAPAAPRLPRAGHGESAIRYAGPHRFVVVNHFADPICRVTIIPNASPERATNWLAPGERIAPEGSREFGLAAGRYEIVFGECTGGPVRILREYRDIRIEGHRTFHARSGADEEGLPATPLE